MGLTVLKVGLRVGDVVGLGVGIGDSGLGLGMGDRVGDGCPPLVAGGMTIDCEDDTPVPAGRLFA
jgi:hypothetical protein